DAPDPVLRRHETDRRGVQPGLHLLLLPVEGTPLRRGRPAQDRGAALDRTVLSSPEEQWQDYSSLRPGLAAGGLGALFISTFLWSRRSEFAAYRTFGTTSSQIGLMVLAELALVYVPALAVGLAACVSTMAIGIS